MPIVVIKEGRLDCPTVVCYVCGEPIVGRGNALWSSVGDNSVEFAHKAADNPICAENSDIFENSMEIEHCLNFALDFFEDNEGEK